MLARRLFGIEPVMMKVHSENDDGPPQQVELVEKKNSLREESTFNSILKIVHTGNYYTSCNFHP